MRTRYRRTVLRSTPAMSVPNGYSQVTWCTDGTISSWVQPGYSYPSFDSYVVEERMKDSLGKGQSHSVKHWKSIADITDTVPHGKKPYSAIDGNGTVEYTAGNAVIDGPYYCRVADAPIAGWNLPDPYVAPPGWTVLPSVIYDEQKVINDLFESAKGLKADMLLNVVEGNQLWPALKSLITCYPQLARNWGQIRKVIRTASGSYLAWKFGISPVLSDLANIAKFAPDMTRQYNRYVNSDTLRYSKVFPLKCTFGIPEVKTTMYGVPTTVLTRRSWQGFQNGDCCVRYVLVIKPSVRYSSDLFNKADFLLRKFVTSPTALAWEKVPFSFVADWFADLRPVLDQIDNTVRLPPFEVVSLTKSTSIKLATDSFYDWYSPCSGAKTWAVKASHRESSYYERAVLQAKQKLRLAHRFGKSQAGISAALIAQRLS